MSSKQNIIYIYFKGKHLITSKSQYQYNHGQFLYFADLNLPQAFEVHFSNKDKGDSKTQIGSNKLVEIPDEYFWNGALMIYAWIYLHSETTDGETVYEVRIPLIKRAKPTDEEPLPQQESAMERAIAELNTAVEITTENANKTGEDKAQVSDIRDEVVDLKEDIDATAEDVAQNAQDAIDASRRSEASAQNAAEFEEGAHDYSEEAKQYAQQALESKNTAKQKADIATDASAEVLSYRDETKGYRNDVQTLKGQIDETADAVSEDAQRAREDAGFLRNASATATTLAAGSDATVNLTDGQFAFGIPRGEDAVNIVFDTDAILINVNSSGRLPSATTIGLSFRVFDGNEAVIPDSFTTTALPNVRTYSRIKGLTNTISFEYASNTLISTTSGVVTVTIVYNGETYTRNIPYSVIRGASDAVNVYVGKDSIVIHVPENGILTRAVTVEIPVRVYDGTELVTASISASTLHADKWIDDHTIQRINIPARVTAGQNASVSYTFPAEHRPDYYNTVNITITYKGVSYVKNIAYAVVEDGANGEKGDTGESGVYIGTDEPTDKNINVWIDTDGSEDVLTGLKYVKDDPTDGGGVIEGHISANTASGAYAHSEGDGTTASAPCSHAEGYQTTASSTCSHAEGRETNANAFYAHAEGYLTTVTSMCGHAEGAGNTVSGDNAHAEGSGNTVTASGLGAHAEGNNTTVSERWAHAEGGGTTASGECSHAEGAGTRATGGQAHSEGGGTLASGNQAHAEGASTIASGDNSHAENLATTASGACSHASGVGTIAQRKSQFVIGEYNKPDLYGVDMKSKGEYVFIVGNGDSGDKSNAFGLKWDGTFVFANGTEITPAQFAALLQLLS